MKNGIITGLRGKSGFFRPGPAFRTDSKVRVCPNGQASYFSEVPEGTGHYHEIRYFVNSLLQGTPIDVTAPKSAMLTIRLAEAEVASADRGRELVRLS